MPTLHFPSRNVSMFASARGRCQECTATELREEAMTTKAEGRKYEYGVEAVLYAKAETAV